MNSFFFLRDIINPAREAHGERAVRNNDFIARCMDELDLNESFVKVFQPAMGRPSQYLTLDMEQMTLVGMRESKAVRRSVLAKLKELENKAITPALTQEQMLAQAYVYAIERGAQQGVKALLIKAHLVKFYDSPATPVQSPQQA